MRKVLASFLAASMVASIGATMSFAANTAANIQVDVDSGVNSLAVNHTYDTVRLIISPNSSVGDSDDIEEVRSVTIETDASPSDVKIAKALNNVKFNDVTIDGQVYNLTLKHGTGRELNLTFSPATTVKGLSLGSSVVRIELSDDGGKTWNSNAVWDDVGLTMSNATLGTGGETADVEGAGDFENLDIAEVVKCYGDGTPIPLTEKRAGVDKDLNGSEAVQSGKTLYFMLRDDDACVVDKLEDDLYWKLKITKGNNGKYIKAITDTTKNFSGNLYDAFTGEEVGGTGGKRHRYVKVELNDIYTDDEYKITLDMRISAKTKAVDTGVAKDDDTEIKVKDFHFYMKNIVKKADNDWEVGVNGLMLDPLENDWNTVTYYDEDGDLAYMKFFADSDVGKFFAQLSTKWEHADYASYFNDQDAFIFNFVGSPKLSSTSRADLAIYNPFVDEDGNETIDPATATIYQVIDGDLYDVTDSFEYKETDETGDMAYVTRTRFLGTYIICEKPVEEAVSDETVPDDLTPDEQAPVETPDSNAGGKNPANTGRYL